MCPQYYSLKVAEACECIEILASELNTRHLYKRCSQEPASHTPSSDNIILFIRTRHCLEFATM